MASPPRSIATEVALLFLHDLECRMADDPQLLVSSEAILSFSIIKRSDRARWEHWKAILSKHQKSEVVAAHQSSRQRTGSANAAL